MKFNILPFFFDSSCLRFFVFFLRIAIYLLISISVVSQLDQSSLREGFVSKIIPDSTLCPVSG